MTGVQSTREAMAAGSAAMVRMAATIADLEATVLAGWPDQYGWPSATELGRIVAVQREISIHQPELGDSRCWLVACNAVARMRQMGVG